ncbi:MAG: hypothetical protein ABJC13_20215 [Acidobacteriota bacterium]
MRPHHKPVNALLVTLFLAAPLAAADLPLGLTTALAARWIGPLSISGRVTALAVVESDPDTYYVGAAAGGVWKTTNGGTTFVPVFDGEEVSSIGALAVFQSDPKIVWAGTGECNVRNTVSYGDGVYRSTDGGKSWNHLGLPASERIARIVLHPTNPDIAWVAALGPLWNDGGGRGVYRTEDGGKSWQRTLYLDERTGAADIAIDPSNPDRLLASLWQVRRRPWEFLSGGPGSGLYASADGGKSWSRRGPADGLPAGAFGRIAIAFAPSRPATVYALIELNREGALVRSDDGGTTWHTVARGANRYPRPFYFAELQVDPQDPERLYQLHFNVDLSEDGGATVKPLLLQSAVHPDLHALWIDPNDPRRLLLGTDGGLYASRDRGLSAERKMGLPLSQFYDVATDTEGRVYGGTQDNGAWTGPLSAWAQGGGGREDWTMIGGGDAVVALPDRNLAGVAYSMESAGGVARWDRATGEWRDVFPPAPLGIELRFGWNTPMVLDRADNLLVGSQFVHRSTDRGESWSVISPDLTTNRREWQKAKESGGFTPDVAGEENFTTLIALAVSPASDAEIWAGSDDGRVHVTTDGGGHWQEVGTAIPGLPPYARIQRIVARGAGRALLLADGHMQGNRETYVFETVDLGAHWARLGSGSELRGPALSILAPCDDPRTLLLGTEQGLWLSLDHGASWAPWRNGVPPAPVSGLALSGRDLVIATHGRGLFAIDDFVAVCAVPVGPSDTLSLLSVSAAPQRAIRTVGGGRGAMEPRGTDRAYGALITLASPVATPEDHPATVTIFDAAGTAVRSFEQPLGRGIQRIAWGFEHDALWRRPRPTGRGDLPSLDAGPEVPPGPYELAVRVGEQEVRGTVQVVGESNPTAVRWKKRVEVGQMQQQVTEALEEVFRLRADLAQLEKRSPGLKAKIATALSALERFDRRLRREPGGPLGAARDNLRSRLFNLEDTIDASFSPPAAGTVESIRVAGENVQALRRDLDAFERGEITTLKRRLGR